VPLSREPPIRFYDTEIPAVIQDQENGETYVGVFVNRNMKCNSFSSPTVHLQFA